MARIGRPLAVPPPYRSISCRSVMPKATSISPPWRMLPASCSASVPRERPVPWSR